MNLRAEGVFVHLPEFDLLRDINIEIPPGKVTAIVGPNGAGKSSLLRVLTGDLIRSEGSVELNGRELEAWPLQQRACMMAVLPQHTPLNFPFSAHEVVALGRIPHHTGSLRDREIASAALHALDGSHFADRLYPQLSGGEKQRVQLARVLAQIWDVCESGDRYLVLDEPTSAFDLSHQLITLDIVRRCADEGIGVLIVLHDLNLAARCADNLIVMMRGQIAAQGKPQEILTESLIERVFRVKAVILQNPIAATPLVVT